MQYDVEGSIRYLEGRKRPKEQSHFKSKDGSRYLTNAEALFELKKMRDAGIKIGGKDDHEHKGVTP